MANGDIAADLGWVINAGTDDRRNGWDRINYALDRAAEQRKTLRDTVLPAINQPVFAVQRSTTWASIVKTKEWMPVPASAWATPILNDGFTRWGTGQLTIAKSGVYRVQAHVQFPTAKDYVYMAAQLVKNTLVPDTTGTVAKSHPTVSAAVDVHGLVRLVAGDVLTLLVRQQSADSWDLQIENSPADLTLSLEWVRA